MKCYETTDFHLAVALYTVGHNLVSVDKTNPQRAIFKFEYEPTLNDSVRKFFIDNLSTSPRLTLLNTRIIKDRLRSGV